MSNQDVIRAAEFVVAHAREKLAEAERRLAEAKNEDRLRQEGIDPESMTPDEVAHAYDGVKAKIDRDDLARTARNADALVEEIGMEAFLDRYGVDRDAIIYMTEQRGLRMGLIVEQREGEISTSKPTPVDLGPVGTWLAPSFGAAWVDGFFTGLLARHDSSSDIPGIASDTKGAA